MDPAKHTCTDRSVKRFRQLYKAIPVIFRQKSFGPAPSPAQQLRPKDRHPVCVYAAWSVDNSIRDRMRARYHGVHTKGRPSKGCSRNNGRVRVLDYRTNLSAPSIAMALREISCAWLKGRNKGVLKSTHNDRRIGALLPTAVV